MPDRVELHKSVLRYFYPVDTPLRRLLVAHSMMVRDKALALAEKSGMDLNTDIVVNGAMMHDIGIIKCNAPDIFCEGTRPYLMHGTLGAEMLRDYGRVHLTDMELYARICERHTGAGITAEEIKRNQLPLPEMDLMPETPEEKLICFADKFFSKSGSMQEKTVPHIRRSMERFGAEPLRRFDELCRLFMPDGGSF